MTRKLNTPREQAFADKTHFVMQSLITGNFSQKSILHSCLKEFEIDMHSPKRLILIQANSPLPIPDIPLFQSRILELSDSLQFDLFRFIYPDSCQILLDHNQSDTILPPLREFTHAHRQLLKTAVGIPAALSQLKKSYLSAVYTLQNMADTNQYFAVCDSMLLELLLTGISSRIRTEYLQSLFGNLSEEECRFLYIYFQEDQSLKETGARLYLHKNTVQNRLHRIIRKTGLDPRRFEDAVLFYLGLKLKGMEP